MTAKSIIFLVGMTFLTKFAFPQKEYEVAVRHLPFYYDNTDTILKHVSDNSNSDFKLHYFYKFDNSIRIYSATKPFPNDFSADSCVIYKTKVYWNQDFRLSDSVMHFTYSIEYFYKNKSKAKTDLRALCRQFDLPSPKTKDGISKTLYFELDNVNPICISHYIQIGQIQKWENGFYSIGFTFHCNGERDNRTYIIKHK